MIEIPFWLVEVSFAVIWMFIRIFVWSCKKQIDWKREAILLLMFVNLAVLIRFTFFPFSLVNGRVQPLVFYASEAFPFRINLVPFVHLFDYDSRRDLLLNVIGNTTMFIPSGIILPFIYKQLNTFGKVLSAGVGLSLCIEVLHLPFSTRASDIGHLILNILGIIVGYGIYTCVKKREKQYNP